MLGTPTVSASVESGKLIGSAGIVDDAVTLSGQQLNAILGTAGTIDLYGGTDTINLTSTSIKLNTLANGSMSGVEAISASTATSGVTITLSNQTEAFTITGGSGHDTIVGGAGSDTLAGGLGNDRITYDGSDFSIAGGADIDTLVVTGAATINLSSADQSGAGDAANVTEFENVDANGSTAAVNLTGDGNANALTGGLGNDTIDGGLGADTLIGGASNDTVTYDGSDATIAGGLGTDTLVVTGALGATINLSSATDQSGANDTAKVIEFENVDASTATVAVSLTSNSGINALTGGSGNDTIDGGAGSDTLIGGAGNDRIAFDGADVSIAGGADTDTLVVNGAATINLSSTDQSGAGDTANVSEFENVDANGSTAAVNLTGDGNANALTGGLGNDTIDGGLGADTLAGGPTVTRSPMTGRTFRLRAVRAPTL
jgi:Ca2+-binding RTX toxin-like protein